MPGGRSWPKKRRNNSGMLELAAHIVKTKSGHFKPQEFEDHYEEALKDLLKKKQAGEKIEAPRERAPAKVINLMIVFRAEKCTDRKQAIGARLVFDNHRLPPARGKAIAHDTCRDIRRAGGTKRQDQPNGLLRPFLRVGLRRIKRRRQQEACNNSPDRTAYGSINRHCA